MTAISVDYDGTTQEILTHSGLRFVFSVILLNLIFSAVSYINKYKEILIDKINMTLIIFSILFIVIISKASEEKLNYKFTEEELDKLDFAELYNLE